MHATKQTEVVEQTVEKNIASPVKQNEIYSDSVQCKFSAENVVQREKGNSYDSIFSGSNQTGMPNRLKSGLENLSGYDMSSVRVHYNSPKPKQLGALAYAQGTNIHLGAGQEKHLPHEGWHVVQQMQGRVRPTMQMKNVAINSDSGLEKEADVMGLKALSANASNSTVYQKVTSTNLSGEDSDKAPVQGRFGFEIEVPILLLHKQDMVVPNAVDATNPDYQFDDVPVDAGMRAGEVDIHGGPHLHVNVDHNGALNSLVKAELKEYGSEQNFLPAGAEQQSLNRAWGVDLFPNGASIMEVVTDAWDESTLTRAQALANINGVINWISDRYDEIDGNNQVALGNYFIGSNSLGSDLFQPRLGYFHATYGVKLSQVPRVFQQTTSQKNRLNRYANRRANIMERPHANNLRQTHNSIANAKTAMKAIKRLWPRVGAGRFTRGSKNWQAGTEGIFLGFLTLLTNYLLMFRTNNNQNLAKQMVGMHYYKSDLYDVAQQLPNEIINTLTGNAPLLTNSIAAIATSVGLAANSDLGGPMAGVTLSAYLQQLFTGAGGVVGQDNSGADLRDPFLNASINPYSDKLGPDMLGPVGNQEYGVVMENRHLEYLDPNYGANLDNFRAWSAQERQNSNDQATLDSIGAREDGPARRPIDQWEDIMIGIYDMVKAVNSR